MSTLTMSYQIKVGKTMKDTFYTLTPVNRVLRIFVLTNVKREQNKLVQCWSWTKTLTVLTVTLIVNIAFLVIKVQNFQGNFYGELKFTDSLQLTYLLGFMEYIIDLHYVYKTRHSCLKYFQFYANIDKVLGVPNFTQIKTMNLTIAVIIIISFSVSSVFDYISWSVAYGPVIPTVYGLDYVYGFVNALTALDLVSHLVQIEHRVKKILGQIEEYYGSSLSLSSVDDVDIETTEKIVNRLKTVSYSKGFDILSLSKCYVMVLEQVNYINTAYGVRVGAFTLNILIYLIHLINVIIRLMLGQFMVGYPAWHLTMASTVLRTANYAFVLFMLVHRCEQTYQLCSGIVRWIDLTVVGKKIPVEAKAALQELRSLVVSRPVRFHGANFFTLDYPLLVSVASVVVTYSIILLQSMR